MNPEYARRLKERVARQQAFFAGSEPGDLLVFVNSWRHASLEGFLCGELHRNGPERVLNPNCLDAIIGRYVEQARDSLKNVYAVDDDCVPSGAFVYAGIGVINAAITGLEPFHDECTSWLEPNLSWEQIDNLRFDPDNKWVRFALDVNRALWRRWEGDWFVLPFLHRSPLDAANSVRGNVLFEEMYTEPDRVKKLIDWCADWSIAIERFLAENAPSPAPKGWGTAIWDTWLPDGGVFVNGDPVGLISREMMPEFEQPYTAKLFTACGGGFFHNHTIGLYQVDQVARTPGLLVQEFVVDPKVPNLPEVLLGGGPMAERILAASLDAPIKIESIAADTLDKLLPIVRQGRFILGCWAPEGTDPDEVARKVRAVSNIR